MYSHTTSSSNQASQPSELIEFLDFRLAPWQLAAIAGGVVETLDSQLLECVSKGSDINAVLESTKNNNKHLGCNTLAVCILLKKPIGFINLLASFEAIAIYPEKLHKSFETNLKSYKKDKT